MTADDQREQLHEKIDELDDPEVVVVGRFVDAVLTPVEHELLAGSWLTIKPWAEAFLAQLRGHHAINADPLSRLAFEAAFNTACEAAGWEVTPAASATHRFYDTTVWLPAGDRLRLSLKATAAKNLNTRTIHISKLTEAAWIQDARTQAGRHEKIVELFRQYRRVTDSIIILRCFRQAGGSLLYELVELPTSVFAAVDDLTVAQAQTATINIPPGAVPRDLGIRIDRSDAKITVTGIRIEVCTVHGRWTVPNLSGVSEDEPDQVVPEDQTTMPLTDDT